MNDEHDLYDRTEAWVAANPHAYGLFRRFAAEFAKLGRRFGIGLVAERVRWEMHFDSDDEDYKVNNSYRAYLARRLIKELPQLRGLLEVRVVQYGPDANVKHSRLADAA